MLDEDVQTESNEWAGALGRWFIFAAGLAILVAALILPAQIDLRETRDQRDLALHIEQSHNTRIERYEAFLAEMKHPAPETVKLLAMSQLGMIASDRQALIIPGQPADPQLFEFLEPTPVVFEPRIVNTSRLETLTTGLDSRFWFVLIGAVSVMYGILPAAKSSASPSTLVS